MKIRKVLAQGYLFLQHRDDMFQLYPYFQFEHECRQACDPAKFDLALELNGSVIGGVHVAKD
jgi:hypothetical protein